MIPADAMREHRRHGMAHLSRLRMLARSEAGVPLPADVVHEVDEATGAILAEAKAAERAVLSTIVRSRRRDPGAARFLAARLARLATAAEDAVSAARDGNGTALRQHLHRFDALTSAMWTVQLAVCPAATPLLRSTAGNGSSAA
jgi:hypothetical protein